MNTYIIGIRKSGGSHGHNGVVNGEYFVFSANPAQHISYSQAVAEAERLAKGSPGKEYVIFTQVKGVKMEIEYNRTEIEYNSV